MSSRKRKSGSLNVCAKFVTSTRHDDPLPILPFTTEQHAKNLEQDTVNLTDNNKYFPDLVWGNVLAKMRNMDDIENCTNASAYFRKHLQDKRNQSVVFPKVFFLLSKRFADINNKDDSYREPKPMPNRLKKRFIPGPHPMKGFWKCRLISKSWNKAIEDLHQRDDNILQRFGIIMDPQQHQKDSLLDDRHLFKWALTKFEPIHEIPPASFFHQFYPTHYDHLNEKPTKNPFIGRSVSIFIPWFPINNVFYLFGQSYPQNIKKILKHFGEEIWYCNISFIEPQNEIQHLSTYNGLVELVKCMHNLKFLKVKYIGSHNHYLGRVGIEIPFDHDARLQLDLYQQVGQNHFPSMPNLKIISTENLPHAIFQEIRTKHPNAIFV